MKQLPARYLLLVLILFISGGASCRNLSRSNDPLAPVVFVGPPTLEDVIYATNTNSASVRQLNSDNVTLTTPGAPSLRATLALERPRRFRLRAKLFGPELDVGSNDELFWMWAKSDPERALYYARHDQFAAAAANRGLPIGVDWLIEAMGLVYLDPAGTYDGPTSRPDGALVIRSQMNRDNQSYSRVLVIDARYGWVLEQQVLDGAGRTLALARCSEHRFYQEAGASLPQRVQIELPPAQLSFQLDVDRYTVNQLQGDPGQLWSRPYYENYRLVDIAAPAYPAAIQGAPGMQQGAWSQSQDESSTAYRPRYRGMELR